ncbi:MAG: transketolase [Desulfovibrio sp.]|nr:transketolase [Desulfovibrio sp.]MBI4957960.1 transketolase [Desulfovibrio sp.]
MRKTCLNMVYRLAQTDARIVFIGSDLGSGTLDEFRRELPERFFMEGISEQCVVGMAAGMALDGKIPYVNTIATFLTRRAFEQIAVDVCMQGARVRLIGNGGGLVYAPLGPTHIASEDISLMRTLPGMAVVCPADAEEMTDFMLQSVEWDGPIYIRLAKGYDPVVTRRELGFSIGKGIVYREGADVLFVTTGVTLGPVLESADRLSGMGISSSVLHLPTVKPFDQELFLDLAAQTRAVVPVEENSLLGGLGSACAEVLAEANYSTPKRFKRIALPDAFPDRYGSQADLLAYYGLEPGNIVRVAQRLLEI